MGGDEFQPWQLRGSFVLLKLLMSDYFKLFICNFPLLVRVLLIIVYCFA